MMKKYLQAALLALAITAVPAAQAASKPAGCGNPCVFGWVLIIWDDNTGKIQPGSGEQFSAKSTCKGVEKMYDTNMPGGVGGTIKAACKLHWSTLEENVF